jgi:hypothetical protein
MDSFSSLRLGSRKAHQKQKKADLKAQVGRLVLFAAGVPG